jgi:glycerate kinase
VLTGEGRLDAQTAAGKAPAEVARRARQAGLPCAAIAGRVAGAPEGMFDLVVSLEATGAGVDPLRHGRRLLHRAAAGATLALLGGPS